MDFNYLQLILGAIQEQNEPDKDKKKDKEHRYHAPIEFEPNAEPPKLEDITIEDVIGDG